jgi:hypothetical protein
MLCFYGLSMSSEIGARERAALWPQYVRDRIKATYGYLGASLIVSAGVGMGVARSPQLLRIVSGGGILVRVTSQLKISWQSVLGDTGVQNVPRSAWVKTDTASKMANATSVETRLLVASGFTHELRGTFCTPVLGMGTGDIPQAKKNWTSTG